MLSRNKFIRGSVDLHLFFCRIMKEHAFFLQVGFTEKDVSYITHANKLRMELDKLLLDVVNLSNCVASPAVIRSGEIVTQHTIRAEEVSTFYTGVIIPTNITTTITIIPNTFNAFFISIAPFLLCCVQKRLLHSKYFHLVAFCF